MYYDTYKSGKRIQELRRSREITQAQLAEALSISLDYMKKIERGRRGCSVDLLITLSAEFNVSLDFLVLGNGDPAEETRNKIQALIDDLTALKNAI